MDELKERIANYFIERNKQLPSSQENNLYGWCEWYRIDSFLNKNSFNCEQMKGENFAKLDGRVYQVWEQSLNAIVAYYEADDEILWLDDHEVIPQ